MVAPAPAAAAASAATTGSDDHLLNEEILERRCRRKNAYHLATSSCKLPTDPEEDDCDFVYNFLLSLPRGRAAKTERVLKIHKAKSDLLHELSRSGGDVTTPDFVEALDNLVPFFDLDSFDARVKPHKQRRGSATSQKKVSPDSPTLTKRELEGMWVTLSKPTFRGSLGKKTDGTGDNLYTLGRMAFDMFRPTNLVCSIQGTFNPVHVVRSKDREGIASVPKSLMQEVISDKCCLRKYDIVTAFTIEPYDPKRDVAQNAPNRYVKRPIRGLMTTKGYVLADPNQTNRLSIWFVGGTVEVDENDPRDNVDWRRVFENAPTTRRPMGEKARLFGAKVLMGATPCNDGNMEADGKMSYKLTRPLGGHGVAYVDVVYLDDTLRVAKDNRGGVYVFARVPHFPDE